MQLQAEEEEEETAASDGRAPPANDTLQTHYFVSAPPVCVCLCVCVGVCVCDRQGHRGALHPRRTTDTLLV